MIFIRRDVTICQILLHATQHYVTKLLLNAGGRVTIRICLCVLQLLHLSGGQLYLAIPRPARANGSDMTTVEFKTGKVLNTRRVREAADADRIWTLQLLYPPLPGQETIPIDSHGYGREHRNFVTPSREDTIERLAVIESRALTSGDDYRWPEEIERVIAGL